MPAVLFDWRGTLVADFPDSWWLERAYRRLARAPTEGEIERLVGALARATEQDDIRAGFLTEDCSASLHRKHNFKWFQRAGLDDELALALYELDFDSATHPFYLDVPSTLESLRARGIGVAIVSDIHFDLRPEFESAGLDECVSTYVLSFEHGIQKPDRRMFEIALDQLEVKPSDAVMFGDRASRDGGAAACGIPTVILPPLLSVGERGLGRFLGLWDAGYQVN
jgi:HAD superfamily hydrolase (TIGR01509 family)